jgi:O-antigen biosynthesis protein
MTSARPPEIEKQPTNAEAGWVETPAEAGRSEHSVGAPSNDRPAVRGKFIWLGDEKLYVKGVTYGAFTPDAEGREYHDLDAVERDFELMAEHGINAVRIPHTMPPLSLIDAAHRHGLYVMVGLSAEQYAGYLTDRHGAPDVRKLVRERVRACARHPAILCYALGNEIPASTVRWLGRRRVERYLRSLFEAVKEEDPDGLVTYVNYPSTEYLQLPFLDLVCFNVYLEAQDRLEAYLGRLHTLAQERPLVMSELGFDSLRNGEQKQADVLRWQVQTAFRSGCSGGFIFAWTDEWHRAGEPVDDWRFGLTRHDRTPKPALSAVQEAFVDVPVVPEHRPCCSVVVCSYNGNHTIDECLDALARVNYPDYEVIVVDDGSITPLADKARSRGFRAIRTDNGGLSNARNIGLQAACGVFVAYVDDDAFPDPDWLSYIVDAFTRTDFVGLGGPNIPPADDPPIAACVARAPGGPMHVLLSDAEAEHVPGCNMAFRRSALEAIGGFDPQFRIAGDDVDVCWRLQERGWRIGFHPSAVVWHRRRPSVRAYLRQQMHYGAAEALLERKWPERFNSLGHARWSGRVYGNGLGYAFNRVQRIYHGTWGTAPFQSIYQRAPSILSALPLMPEWYLVVFALALFSGLGALWRPLLLALPLLTVAVFATVAQAARSVAGVPVPSKSRVRRALMRGLTLGLFLTQPIARLYGRLKHGLVPWPARPSSWAMPLPSRLAVWRDDWRAPSERLEAIEAMLRTGRHVALRGGEFDRWDLELRGGILGAARLVMDVEDHGAGTQLVRVRVWPRFAFAAIALTLAAAGLAFAAASDGAWLVAGLLAFAGVLIGAAAILESGGSIGALRGAAVGHVDTADAQLRRLLDERLRGAVWDRSAADDAA